MSVERHAIVVTERPGEPPQRQNGLPSDAVAQALILLTGAHDTTVTISRDASAEQLLVAVDGSRAVLGLERPDGLLQFVTAEPRLDGETFPFTIGRQQTDIETRYLVDLQTAVNVVCEWLAGREMSDHGNWEHR